MFPADTKANGVSSCPAPYVANDISTPEARRNARGA
jgi:hypothetical protein